MTYKIFISIGIAVGIFVIALAIIFKPMNCPECPTPVLSCPNVTVNCPVQICNSTATSANYTYNIINDYQNSNITLLYPPNTTNSTPGHHYFVSVTEGMGMEASS